MTPLEKALRQVCADLTAARIRFALVGGLAVSARTEPRFTRDADLAVAVASDAEAEGLIRTLRRAGYEIEAIVEQEAVGRLATARLRVLVIAERHQLVFHVVPQPSRIGWFTDVYTHLITGQPWTRPADASASVTPAVDVGISSLRPLPAYAAEWWAADNVPLDLPISVRVEPDHVAGGDAGGRGLAGYFGLVGQLLSSTWRFMSPWTMS